MQSAKVSVYMLLFWMLQKHLTARIITYLFQTRDRLAFPETYSLCLLVISLAVQLSLPLTTLTQEQLITSGVPQGSVLGPLLFIVYMSELPTVVRSSLCALFADDTLAYTCNCKPRNTPCCALQSDANMIHDWSLKWNAIFNATKSQHKIIAGRRQECVTDFHLSIDEREILPVSDTKHLGVHLSCNLSWSLHISKLVKRVAPKSLC